MSKVITCFNTVRRSVRRCAPLAKAFSVSSRATTRPRPKQTWLLLACGLSAATTVTTLAWRRRENGLKSHAQCVAQPAEADQMAAGKVRKDLPDISLDEVSKHNSIETGIWVVYIDGVYDISQFIEQHPGGSEKVMLAAGGSVEPYWDIFAAHKTAEVKEILEELRIGNVHPSDRSKRSNTAITGGPYSNDPQRSPVLKVNTEEPFNAEIPTSLLVNSYITPNSLFFVRNHLPVPQVDPDEFILEVKGEGLEPVRLSLDDLRSKFKPYTVTATVQCAGNRRSELAKVKPVKGLNWMGGAIGNAQWTGVRLRDVLLFAGINESEDYSLRHIHLEGLDCNRLTGEHYGASIPTEKAMDVRGDCLLAYEMNGEVLPRDHGYPLRAVIPGTVGARNVKWLKTIEASRDEYSGFWQQRDYKGFSPSINWDTVDFSKAPAIQELPVTSLICSPREGSTVQHSDGTVTVEGMAWSGGGREVIRVDVSSDGGQTWQVAELTEGVNQSRGRAWAWTFWEASVPIRGNGDVQLCCKAVDSAYNVQPDTTAPIWNLRGCLSNAWHQVNCTVK